ncbi:MAG TPA: hypothetical protein VKR06_28090 [Ktedonosporobacter sp.]|nr:hypothetical protein [Ktedonosporobacter sp.]
MLTDPRPSFKTACQRHAVTVEHLLQDLSEHHIFGVTPAIARRVYEQGEGKAEVIDVLLQSLTRLAGTPYTRKNVGGLSFLTNTEIEAEGHHVHSGHR